MDGARVASSGYNKEEEVMSLAMARVILFFSLAVHMLILFSSIEPASVQLNAVDVAWFIAECAAFAILLFLSSVLGMYVIAIAIALPRSAKQWHSCEHKLIKIVRKRAPVNMTELKKASSFSFMCGVFWYGAMYMLVLALMLAVVGVIDSLAEFLFFVIECPIIFGYVLQKLSTREPTEDQYRETIRMGEELLFKLKEAS